MQENSNVVRSAMVNLLDTDGAYLCFDAGERQKLYGIGKSNGVQQNRKRKSVLAFSQVNPLPQALHSL
ncbi:hypothetical protein D3C76_1480190 [compost metagenome]|jgi:hypothetical protein